MSSIRMIRFVLLILALLYSATLRATSCPEKKAEEAFDDAAFVFLGTVSGINDKIVEFKVERFWKAALDTNQIRLRLHQNPRDLSFELGREYVVYVRSSEYGNRTSYCDGTKLKADAALDLEYLKSALEQT